MLLGTLPTFTVARTIFKMWLGSLQGIVRGPAVVTRRSR